MKNSCANCDALFYGQVPGQRSVIGHQCRRHPPQILMIPKASSAQGLVEVSIDALWPVVNLKGAEDPGCAEWIAAEPGKFIGAPDSGLDS